MNNKIIVAKELTFDAAHHLPGYDGPCSNVHGHTYRLQVGVVGLVNPRSGMVVDFKDLFEWMQEVTRWLDHADLNKTFECGFPNHMPTAENMVMWFVDRIATYCKDCGIRLCFIRLWETPTSYAEWRA